MQDLSRTLTVLADGDPVAGFTRARLTGTDAVGLFPMPFRLRLWNLPDKNPLTAAKEISVLHDGSVLASGTVSDVFRRAVPDGTVTEVLFSAGLRLWEAPVSLSVEAGVTVSETVCRILTASGTGIPLLSFPGEDPVRARGQAFSGRAAECVTSALSAAGARACLTPSGLCVIPSSGLPVSLTLSEHDLTDVPVRAGSNLLVLRTKVAGWPLGKTVSVQWQGETAEGLVTERSIDADSAEGSWETEILMEVTI